MVLTLRSEGKCIERDDILKGICLVIAVKMIEYKRNTKLSDLVTQNGRCQTEVDFENLKKCPKFLWNAQAEFLNVPAALVAQWYNAGLPKIVLNIVIHIWYWILTQ
jgi:hypothetical protein